MDMTPLGRAQLVDKGRNLWREAFPFELKAVNEESRTITIIGTTEEIDRSGDVIMQAGLDWRNFRKNPVIMWAHNYSQLPIGKATRIASADGKTELDVEFTPADVNPFGDSVFRFLKWNKRAPASIGFIPKKVEPRDPEATDVSPWGGNRRFLKAEVLEVSVAPVPDNPGAVASVKSLYAEAKTAGAITAEDEAELLKSLSDDEPPADMEPDVHDAHAMKGDVDAVIKVLRAIAKDQEAMLRARFKELGDRIEAMEAASIERSETQESKAILLEDAVHVLARAIREGLVAGGGEGDPREELEEIEERLLGEHRILVSDLDLIRAGLAVERVLAEEELG